MPWRPTGVVAPSLERPARHYGLNRTIDNSSVFLSAGLYVKQKTVIKTGEFFFVSLFNVT